jgi:imidazolonepropionase-like amidohydrolase
MNLSVITRFFCLCIVLIGSILHASSQSHRYAGIADERNQVYAFTNATLHINHETVIPDGIMLIQKQSILMAGKDVVIPTHAIIIDCNGKHIYPSFIELYSGSGIPEYKSRNTQRPQYDSPREGAFYPYESIRPETDASSIFNYSSADFSSLMNMGFGLANIHQRDGIVRGNSVAVLLKDENSKLILKPQAFLHYSLRKGAAQQEYPSSQTGSIALLRQFFYDAQAYKKAPDMMDENISISSFQQNRNLPYIFETNDYQEIFRAAKIAQEFGYTFVYKTNGNEYQRIKEIAALKTKLIVPVVYPMAMDVSNPDHHSLLTLEDLKHWEWAPSNLSILEKNKVEFAITSDGIKSSGDFFENLHRAVLRGLSKSSLLYALTGRPAEMLGLSSRVGSLEKNKLANFIITENELGDEKFTVIENWIAGNREVINAQSLLSDIRGSYTLKTNGLVLLDEKKLVVKGRKSAPTATFYENDTTTHSFELKHEKGQLILYGSVLKDKMLRIQFRYENPALWNGYLIDDTGKEWVISAERKTEHEEKEKKKETNVDTILSSLVYPQQSYGRTANELNSTSTYLIKNATVWTGENEGILYQTDVLVEQGKIKKIGKSISVPSNVIIIDATGKHLSPGLIDEHSHIALSQGVNEGAESSSAEVRMGDVVNAKDVNIYRQLSGGVTMSQLLHGSANPIGGQSALIKLKWGKTATDMLVPTAPGFIKFALGENVKQSNWGDQYSIRYPQTRMGVEQFFYDMFLRAKKYGEDKNKNKRIDIELQTLWEILNRQRFITCHSYVQSEINMLMKVADSLGFSVNTFTHILEGYKLADKMKAHGANASTFSDWWAYKMEVMDAIPYNATLLTRMGVNTAINSDDAEMARRLNQEAAKAVKYGNLVPHEALKLVTINPAKMLRVDHLTGSIKEGKDADLVIWSHEPLSIYAKAEYTMIEGVIYYSEEKNQQYIERDRNEKNLLIQKMLQAKNNGEPTQPVMKKEYWLYDCEDIHVDEVEYLMID